MNLDDVWNSPGNSPTSVERDAIVRQARDTIRGTRRRRVAFLVWTSIALSATTVLAIYVWLTRVVAGGWALYLVSAMLAAQWAILFYFLRQMRTRRPSLTADATIRESLEALRREAESERRGHFAVLTLFAVVAPLMVAAVLDLRQTGKMAPSEAMSASVLFAAVLAISTTIIVVRLCRVTLPRCRRLKALADQYREGPQ